MSGCAIAQTLQYLVTTNSTHPRDCDTLDQFNTSTQVAGDRDKAKISTLNNLNKARIGNFGNIYIQLGSAEGRTSQNLQNEPFFK